MTRRGGGRVSAAQRATGAACWPRRCAWRATSTSLRRPPPTPSCSRSDVAGARRARLGRGVAADGSPAQGHRPDPPGLGVPRPAAPLAAAGEQAAPLRTPRSTAPPVADDELRLVVLCCHPALAPETQVALTLRLGCGIPTAAVAAASWCPRRRWRPASPGPSSASPSLEPASTSPTTSPSRSACRRCGAHPPRLHAGPHGRLGADLRDDDVAEHAVRLARDARPPAGRHRGGRPAGTGAAHRGAGGCRLSRRGAGAAGRRRPVAGIRAHRGRPGHSGRAAVPGSARAPGRDRGGARVGPDLPGDEAGSSAARHAAGAGTEPDDGARQMRRDLVRRPGRRIGRPRRGLAWAARALPYGHAARAHMLERLGRAGGARPGWGPPCARRDAEQAFFTARAEVVDRGR